MTTVQKSTDTNLNQSFKSAESSEMEGKYLSFWTDHQLFGVPIADVVQIVGIQQITELPEAPHYVKGIINLRGSVIPQLLMYACGLISQKKNMMSVLALLSLPSTKRSWVLLWTLLMK